MAGDEMDLPKLKELKGEKNLSEWNSLLRLHLTYHGLLDYITIGIPGTTPETIKNGVKVMLFLQSSLSTEIRERLINGGVREDETDPKAFYDSIMRILPDASENAIQELMEEFCHMKRRNFTTFHKYLERLQFLRRRLKELVPNLHDDVCVWIAFGGIKEYAFYTHLMIQQKENKLTWEKFTRDLTVEANRESADPALLLQKNGASNGKTGTQTTGKNNNQTGQGKKEKKPHAACGKQHAGGDDNCFFLHPELIEEFKKRTGYYPNGYGPSTTTGTAPSTGSMKFQSGIMGMTLSLTSTSTGNYQITKDTLILDSGASKHTFNDTVWFTSLKAMTKPEIFASANGGDVVVSHFGNVKFTLTNSRGCTTEFELGALFSPNAPCNMISTGMLRSDGAVVDGFNDKLVIKSTKVEIASLAWVSEVAVLCNVTKPTGSILPSFPQPSMASVTFDIMHQRLCHANKKAVEKACKEIGISFSAKEIDGHHCDACFLGKATDFKPNKTLRQWYHPLEMVAVDVIQHPPGHLGYRYTTHFIDAATGYHWLKFSKDKDAAQSILKQWITQIEVQTGLKVQNVGMDGGPEFGQGTKLFSAAPIRKWLESRGTILRTTTPDTPWYNGKIERAGKSITSYARTALIASLLPGTLWPFAEETAATILNLLPSQTDPDWRSPHERWATGIGLPEADRKPYIKHLRVFGCAAFVYIKPKYRAKADKMAPRSMKGRLIGYDDSHGRIYFVYLPDKGTVTRVNAVKFHEGFVASSDEDTDIEHEAVFDDPGLTEEYLPGTKLRSNDVTNPSNTDQTTTYMPVIPPTPIPTSKPDPSTIRLPTPGLTPEPELLDESRIQELPDVYEDPDTAIPSPQVLSEDDAERPEEFSEQDGDVDSVNNHQEDVDQPLEMERPILDVTSATSEAQDSGPRRSGRQKKKPDGFYKNLATGKANKAGELFVYLHEIDEAIRLKNDNSESQAPDYCVSLVQAMKLASPHIDVVPKNFRQARKRDDYYERWLPAMKHQMDQLESLNTWDLVDRPSGARVLPGKWVYDLKMAPQGEWLERARWVVCGNFAVDNWGNNYAAVASATTIKLALIIAANRDLDLYSFDFNTAFLNAKIPPDVLIYVEQPTGLGTGTKVCRLRRALYGLKESPLYWFLTLVPVMKSMGFEPFDSDLCLFFNKKTGVFIVLYVDDLLVAATNVDLVNATRDSLREHFQLKDLGVAKTFLGYEIFRDRENKRVYLSQRRYTQQILKKFGYEDANGVNTPWLPGLELPKKSLTDPICDPVVQKDYIKKTGSINYPAIGTRPDICYTISKLCEANDNPSKQHIQLLNHLFRYLKKTVDLCIVFGGRDLPLNDLQLNGFADATFADDALTRYSTGAHVIILAGGPVFWKSKRQTVMTSSSTEAEFINLTPAGMSLKWINGILKEFGAAQPAPVLLFTDSANALTTVLNPYNSARTRSIDIRYKWIIDQVAKKEVTVEHIAGAEMPADGLTKPLGKIAHAKFVKLLGMTTVPGGHEAESN
jgi:hypothetical protein